MLKQGVIASRDEGGLVVKVDLRKGKTAKLSFSTQNERLLALQVGSPVEVKLEKIHSGSENNKTTMSIIREVRLPNT